MIRQAYTTVSDAFELPRILRLGENLYAASFFLMKLLPAKFILDRARDHSLIGPGSTIIETTSGTFGLALAILCAEAGYKLIVVSDPAVDTPLKTRMEDLGTRVEIVREPAAVGGFQGARLERMKQLQSENPDHFWPSQYDNPHNPDAYAPLVEIVVECIGRFDFLVGTVGSGGSMCGTSNYARTIFPEIKAVGVDTFGSVLFGQPDQKRLLRGLGNSLMPKNLDHTIFDEVHWVSAQAAFTATRLLHRSYALFAGATSGAAFMVARWIAAQNPDKAVVCLLPDEGYRYIETVYSDEWLDQNGFSTRHMIESPTNVEHPFAARPEWARLDWNRRTLSEVLAVQEVTM
ncbi:MAG TPA: cysteine synthase family protein [Pyrinomonadaceae bacterium]|nr:cysteine synthase family protein [Pyrinomonadaceae bacterium]